MDLNYWLQQPSEYQTSLTFWKVETFPVINWFKLVRLWNGPVFKCQIKMSLLAGWFPQITVDDTSIYNTFYYLRVSGSLDYSYTDMHRYIFRDDGRITSSFMVWGIGMICSITWSGHLYTRQKSVRKVEYSDFR